MKTTTQLRKICGQAATVKKVRGKHVAEVLFCKNWGHGEVLKALAKEDWAVSSGTFNNQYWVALV